MPTTVLWAMLAALVSGVAVLLFTKAKFKRQVRRFERRLQRAEAEVRVNESEAEEILLAIDLGVMAYNQDGRLVSANQAARLFFPNPPNTFRVFLERYGKDPKFRSSIFLGSPLATTVFRQGGRSLKISVQTRGTGDSMIRIILIQDVSMEEKEEAQRKAFVANVSHELKTPLTTIKTYSESLIDWGIEEKSTEAIKKDITRIYDDSLRMEKLIADLLLLSSLDSSKLYTAVEQSDLGFLVRQTCDRLQPQAEEKNIKLTCHMMAHIPPVYMDRTAMERVLTNLISNAIKYSGEGSEVTVFAAWVREEVYIKVKDEGMGIGSEELEHIFDRFYRVDHTGSRQHGGTGLGLSIVKELVDLHGARIDVTSALGQGSEFTVMIPMANKVLRETLTNLVSRSGPENIVQEAAARDLSALAGRMGIVAKWRSMSQQDVKALEAVILSDPGPGAH